MGFNRDDLDRVVKVSDLCRQITREAIYDVESDSASDHDWSVGRILIAIEEIMKLYELKPSNFPALGNYFDKNGGL